MPLDTAVLLYTFLPSALPILHQLVAPFKHDLLLFRDEFFDRFEQFVAYLSNHNITHLLACSNEFFVGYLIKFCLNKLKLMLIL
jgi:hypothetical protein